MDDIRIRSIYTDLMRKFRDEGHDVYIVCPYERKFGLKTSIKRIETIHVLGVKTLNIQKTNIIEKGLGTIILERQFKNAIKRNLTDISFDLILYSTPPITFTKVITYLKKKNPSAICYLLLKDIFPQNAVDLGMFSKNSLFYKYFRSKEVRLYNCSDFIGCMSPANVEFVKRHNPFYPKEKVELAPNSLELVEDSNHSFDKIAIRKKFNLPIDKPIFIYGGNLGKPQGIDFIIRCLENNKLRTDSHFLIVGSGTEYNKLLVWYNLSKPQSVSVFQSLPKDDYDKLVQACDVGLIFLDYRFLIPNYPSRLLSYLEYKMPIITATDKNTDIGKIAEDNKYGYWCESNNVSAFTRCVDKFIEDKDSIRAMGEKGYQFLKKNYLVENTYNAIIAHL